jgi:hypothetical protein
VLWHFRLAGSCSLSVGGWAPTGAANPGRPVMADGWADFFLGRVNHSFRDSSRARRRRAAGRIRPELWTAAPADFFFICDLPLCCLAKYPISSTASLCRWQQVFVASGFRSLMQARSSANLRFKDHIVTSAIFKILHEPPELHEFPRTNWRQIDLKTRWKGMGPPFPSGQSGAPYVQTNISGEKRKLLLPATIQTTAPRLVGLSASLASLVTMNASFLLTSTVPSLFDLCQEKSSVPLMKFRQFHNGRKAAEPS